jgi:hypothetical protein
VADGTGSGLNSNPSWKAQMNSPVGFNFHTKNSTQPFNTNILLEDCEALNHDEDTASTTDFEQGDGIKFEIRNTNVTIRRCYSHRNQDAGYDLKGSPQLIEDSFSARNLRSGFKVWFDGVLNNCVSLNNRGQQLILAGGVTTDRVITANFCTFHGGSGTQNGIRVENTGNTALLNDCIISYHTDHGPTNAGSYTSGRGRIQQVRTSRYQNAGNTANNPRYINPVLDWNTVGNNFDNQTFGLTKGYNSGTVAQPAKVISVNLSDSTNNALASTDTVGVVNVANWVNSTVGNETLTNVQDNTGAATTADMAFGNTNFSYINSTAVLASPMTDDAKMMRSMRALSNDGSMFVTVSQVPFATYDVYVYYGGRTIGENVPSTMTINYQLQQTPGVWSNSQTRYIRDDNRSWDGSYNESTATTAAEAVDGNEYVVFRNVTASSFRIRANSGNRTGFCGFQIVEK